MAPPLYGCRSCAVHDAIVFCLRCAARLCLHCDAAVHGATAEAALHPRASLCDACGDAPAVLLCDRTVTLCAVCVARGAPGVTRTAVAAYSGCPAPAEMARLISVDPPQPQQDVEAWIADKLPRLLEDDGQDNQLRLPLPPDWDVAMETARLEKMLADSYTGPPELFSSSPAGYCQPQAATVSSAVHPSSWHNNSDPGGFPFYSGVLPESADFMPRGADHDKMLQDASAVAKMKQMKRDERERAKQRYNEKKKNRRFCKQIMYASRKATADTRKRVKGRFVSETEHCRFFSSAQHDDHPQQLQIDDDGPSSSTSTATTVNRETQAAETEQWFFSSVKSARVRSETRS